MKDVSQMVMQAESKSFMSQQLKHSQNSIQKTSTNLSDKAQATIRALWSKFSVIYGNAWLSQFNDNSLFMREWYESIKGLTPKQVAEGLERCKQEYRNFPPNPLQFRDACIASDDRKEEIYRQVTHWSILKPEEKSREALYIVRSLDMMKFKQAQHKEAEKMFERAYKKMIEFVADGGDLPEIRIEIEQKTEPALPVDELRSRLNKLMEFLK